MTSILMSSPRQSAFRTTFLMQKFKFQRRSCKLSFLFQPRRQSAPESLRTRRLLNLKAIYFVQDAKPFSRLEIPAKTLDFSAALPVT